MKLFSEIIILHEDVPMPEERNFCSFLWDSEQYDSDGDFYWDCYADRRWTLLQISSCTKPVCSSLSVWVFRENNRVFEPNIQDIADLERYIHYKKQGRYDFVGSISNIKNSAVTSLRFSTSNIGDYQLFLETVYYYLSYTTGTIVNLDRLITYNTFYEYFLTD